MKPKPSCIINENSDYNPVTARREREKHRLALTDACLWHGKQCFLSGHTKPSMNWKTHALQRQREWYRSIIGYHVHRPEGKSRRMRVKVSTLIYCKTLQEELTQMKMYYSSSCRIKCVCMFHLTCAVYYKTTKAIQYLCVRNTEKKGTEERKVCGQL